MGTGNMALAQTLDLLESLARRALALWDLPVGATARLINVSENATYLVEAPGFRAILRIHREDYHTKKAIECELAWAQALNREGGVTTPGVYVGKNGHIIQSASVPGLTAPRFMVLFHFVDGVEPGIADDPVSHFEGLGEIAAKTHVHSINWQRPEGFERLIWDADAVFGASPTWGNWRAAPEVTDEVRGILEQVEETVRLRLAGFGKGAERFGLIHADMRLANLLCDGTDTRVIDFDDCGLGWFLYDFAAAISFIENDPQVATMKSAWVRGYRKIRTLSTADVQEIDTFVMLRRMALLAWIGSHIEAPEPQELAPGFARVTAGLGQEYLEKVHATQRQT